MKMQRYLISYLLVMPIFVVLLVVLLITSWTIEKFQLKK
jgi:hypothetical protein